MSDPHPYRGRFAPSPTGPLHFGSLVAALGSWLLARRAGGAWWVRVEDVDGPRTVPGAAERQLRTLAAFGMVSDGPVMWQSQRGDRYQEVLSRLLDQGLAFECHCSRTDLAATGGIHHRCVAPHRRSQPAVRLRVPPGTVIAFHDGLQGDCVQDVHADVGDVILRRADGCWAYQLAVVVDDFDQGITDVVRGADLLDSTARQIFLQRQLGMRIPRHLHLPVVLGADGRKLSKSTAAAPVEDDDPLPALMLAWQMLGQSPEPVAQRLEVGAWLSRALAAFQPERLPRAAAPPIAPAQ